MKLRKLVNIAGIAAASFAIVSTPAVAGHKNKSSCSKLVACAGVNACSGKSACKTANNACAAKNTCKGKGLVMVPPKACEQLGGTVSAKMSSNMARDRKLSDATTAVTPTTAEATNAQAAGMQTVTATTENQ